MKIIEKAEIPQRELVNNDMFKKRQISIDLDNLGMDTALKKRGYIEESEDELFEDDEEEYEEDKLKQKKIDLMNLQKVEKDKKNKELMKEKIDNALQIQLNEQQLEESIISNEEQLNSEDVVTLYENEVNTGKNILLAYYDKSSRKKDNEKFFSNIVFSERKKWILFSKWRKEISPGLLRKTIINFN